MKKTPLLFFILISSYFTCLAQDRHLIDSLQNEIKKYDAHKKELGSKATPLMDSMNANTLYELYKGYKLTNNDSAITYSQKCLDLSQNISYKKGIGNGYTGLGNIAKFNGKFQLALDYYVKALKTREEIGDKKSIATSYGTIANFYYNLGNYPVAIKNYEIELKLYQEMNDTMSMVNIYISLGNSYTSQGNYPEALNNYIAVLKTSEKMGYKRFSAEANAWIGRIYTDEGNFIEALNYQKTALKISKNIKDTAEMAQNYNLLSETYMGCGNYTEALINDSNSLELNEKIRNNDGVAGVHYNMGNIFINTKQYAEALKNQKIALEMFEKIGTSNTIPGLLVNISETYKLQGNLSQALMYGTKGLSLLLAIGEKGNIQEAYSNLAQLYAKLGNYTEAYKNEVLYKRYYDSVFSNENDTKVAGLQMQKDFDKREDSIKLQEAEKRDSIKAGQEKKDAIHAKETENQKRIRNFILGGLGIVLFFLVFVFIQRNKISKEKKRSDELLLNILPSEVAEELKDTGNAKAKRFDEVTVIFTDFKGFTQISEKLQPEELVAEIDYCFKGFDAIIGKYGIEKIKTIGDSYMAAGGLPVANKTHAKDVVNAALEIVQFMEDHKQKRISENKPVFEIRIGINTGPVVAGIVGVKKFAYDIWGDTVNLASRMESSGEPGKVNISGSTYELVKNDFKCTYRGKIQAKNKGEVDMYFVESAST